MEKAEGYCNSDFKQGFMFLHCWDIELELAVKIKLEPAQSHFSSWEDLSNH